MNSMDGSYLPSHARPFSSDLTLTLTLTPNPQAAAASNATHHHPNHLHHDQLLQIQALKPEDRGVRLIQLLLACAAQVSSDNLHGAESCLRLISALSSPSGDSMHRLAARFASSLAARLLRRRLPGLLSAIHPEQVDRSVALQAHLAFSRSLPYLSFAHAVVGHTLLRALAHERVVHVVGLGARDPDLWTPLLCAFSRLPRGPPHLKITCVDSDPHVLESLGSTLVKEAESLDVPFQFHPLVMPLAELNPDVLRIKSGEALAVVSILSLHALLAEVDEGAETNNKLRCRQIDGFLMMVRSMLPKVVAVVEQESNHNAARMVDRFVEGLHYYSALFDSVDSAVGSGALTGEERKAVEEMVGREIENVVVCEGRERVERHERVAQWAGRLGRAGFRQVRLWDDDLGEAKRVVETYPGGDGYGVVTENGCPMICWHNRPMYAVSAWQC